MTELQFDRLETIGDITCTREDFMEASGILNNPEINIYETIDAILHEEAPGKKNDGLKKILKIARRFATINNIKPWKATTSEEILQSLEKWLRLETIWVATYVRRIIAWII